MKVPPDAGEMLVFGVTTFWEFKSHIAVANFRKCQRPLAWCSKSLQNIAFGNTSMQFLSMSL
jgi:hypothetical protein